MAGFVTYKAEENSDEERLSIPEKKKLRKMKKVVTFDDDDEGDDEEKLREELNDLIDNLVDDSDDSDAVHGSRKRKNSDEDYEDQLEDEDYDLIEENLGVKLKRKKRFKRLRRIQDEDSEEENQSNQQEEREAIANELFDGDEDDENVIEQSARREDDIYYSESEEGSESDDFVVGEDGKPLTSERRKRKVIYSDVALQEAQDIFGIDFDYGDLDENENEDEDYNEYEVEEVPKISTQKLKKKKQTIFEVFEPCELKRSHFTDLDNEIRNKDIPERMQLRTVPITPTSQDSNELADEAEWIYKHAFCRATISKQDTHLDDKAKERARKGPQAVDKIKCALDFIRNQNFEVPFISFYRKEYVLPELNINDLWKVYKFDAKWCTLKERKENFKKLFENMRIYQADEILKDIGLCDSIRIITDEDISRVDNIETNEEYNDVYNHFKLYYGHKIPLMQESMRQKAQQDAETGNNEQNNNEEQVIKKAARSSSYTLCSKQGLDSLCKQFGLTPEQFGENIRDNYQRNEVQQEPENPNELAKRYIGKKFKTPDEVLSAAKFMVATQIAHDPQVRKCIREIYRERAKVCVRPTKVGMKEIDEHHILYSMKYLKDKPVQEMENDQFLKLIMGENNKLIELKMSDTIEGNLSSDFLEEIKQLYYRDEFSRNVQDWNDLRAASVEFAIKQIILPEMKKELKAILLDEAKEFVMKICCVKVYKWIKVAPYAVEEINTQQVDDWGDENNEEDTEQENWDTKEGLRIMGIAYVTDWSQSAFGCVIAPDGECIDHLRLPHLLKRKNSDYEDEKIAKETDLDAIKNFILKRKPHLIVVGGESRDALRIVEDIKEIITHLKEEEAKFPNIEVEICENQLASIYANSNRGASEFKDYPVLLKQAISLARRMQDPLVEFSQFCNDDEDILCLKFHPLQDELSKEDLLENIYLEFINRVNEVGVDINKCIHKINFQNLLQFVCGLGPRKVKALVKILQHENLENRTQLVTKCHMGPKVFINCAGFIKIDTDNLADNTETYIELLDSTRIHPEAYEWARKMAVDALEYDDSGTNADEALEEIIRTPERLKDLDLDAFAEELMRQGFGSKAVTLYDIRAELNSRYKDLRSPYQQPTEENLFDMLVKESPETFFIGKLIQGIVTGFSFKQIESEQLEQANPVRNDVTKLWQCPFCLINNIPELNEVWNHFDNGSCPGKVTGIKLTFPSGLSGYIHIKNLSDNFVENPYERVKIGLPVSCRILKIEVDRFSIECTSKTSDLLDKTHKWRPKKDLFYGSEEEMKDYEAEEAAKRDKEKQKYHFRHILHPLFRNICYNETVKRMKKNNQGDVIIRPSSKGPNCLTLTWKVTDDIYQNINIVEAEKPNYFTIGRELWIDDNKFEDLDEIVARHVNPMAAYSQDIIDYKYFKPDVCGDQKKAEAILKEQKLSNPGGIPYIISASKKYPGKFLLSYIPQKIFYHEYVTVIPDGYRFRNQIFNRVSQFIRWFKHHYNEHVTLPTSDTMQDDNNWTSYSTATTNIPPPINPEAIHHLAQNMPNQMLHSLSQVANTSTNMLGNTTPYASYNPTKPNTFGTPFRTENESYKIQSHGHQLDSNSVVNEPQKPDSNTKNNDDWDDNAQVWPDAQESQQSFNTGSNWNSNTSNPSQSFRDNRPSWNNSSGATTPNQSYRSKSFTPRSEVSEEDDYSNFKRNNFKSRSNFNDQDNNNSNFKPRKFTPRSNYNNQENSDFVPRKFTPRYNSERGNPHFGQRKFTPRSNNNDQGNSDFVSRKFTPRFNNFERGNPNFGSRKFNPRSNNNDQDNSNFVPSKFTPGTKSNDEDVPAVSSEPPNRELIVGSTPLCDEYWD